MKIERQDLRDWVDQIIHNVEPILQETVIQLGILTVTDAPAIDVMINLSPLPLSMNHKAKIFPLKISMIDHQNPFFFDIGSYDYVENTFGKNVNLEVNYHDLSN